MKMTRSAILAIAALTSLSLAGCSAGLGQLNGYGKDPMTKIILDRSDGKKITMAQYLAIQKEANACNEEINLQLSGPIEGVVTSAIAGGGTTAAGTVLGYKAAYGAVATPHVLGVVAGINGISGGAQYGYDAVVGYSANKDQLTGNCTERHLRDLEHEADRLHLPENLYRNIHAYTTTFRSLNGTNHPAAGLVENWTGRKAGE